MILCLPPVILVDEFLFSFELLSDGEILLHSWGALSERHILPRRWRVWVTVLTFLYYILCTPVTTTTLCI